ncbi:hypothetical protein [Streptococcus suis]|uniref:hypothetical protein n=1 Tax=Streptococcus suis TaxID=1307 RepID=UPI002AAEBCBF|nr:hypothetical protein [Streptococcus suis]HEM5092801.1 hypothetical protein [Streptococcus suis]HEM5117019.1 hypothetical protein [Streptococcus suis]HEM5142306.1 hypothetical protein [Streptococcus suis]HEM5269124.1 hypothetical protein [Streptococcus suis]
MAKNQELINHIHLAFKEKGQSEQLMQWDNLISIVINRDFDEQKANTFFEAHACLLSVFANDLIEFMLDMFMEEGEEVNE